MEWQAAANAMQRSSSSNLHLINFSALCMIAEHLDGSHHCPLYVLELQLKK